MKILRNIALYMLIIALMVTAVGCTTPSAEPQPEPEVTAEQPVEQPKEAAFTAGEYEAFARGNNGLVNVKVVVDDEKIVSIEITSHGETAGISDAAIENVPNAIVEKQTLAVDTVTGATNTSLAIIEAVTQCIQDAGGDIEKLSTPFTVLPSETVEKQADIVVVGAGLAGLSAAVSAAENGASVILLEKAGMTGGASAASGGEILAAGTSVQAAAGIEDSAQALVDYWLEKGEGKVDEELVTYVGLQAPSTIDWLISVGAKLEMETPTSMPWQDPWRCHKTVEGVASLTGTGGGVGFTIPLTKKAEELGVEILLETPAVRLIMDSDDVVGVEAATKDGNTVNVSAKTVILATGGYDGNDEMMKHYNPLILGRSGLGALHNGDGHRMAQEAGALIEINSSGVALAFDIGATGQLGVDIFGKYLYVLPDGSRFMNEAEYWFIRSGNLIKNNASAYWTIVPSDCGIENLDVAVENGTAQKGETIEELANKTGIDPATLKATVDRYNELCKSGKDTDFGKTNANMQKLGIEGTNLNAIEEGPFYAIYCGLYSISGTFGGPVVTMEGKVRDLHGGIIKGLYAVGELANSGFYNTYYPCSGSSLQLCATIGRLAGETAAKEVK